MATVVTALDSVTAWVQGNICEKIRLKKPPIDENAATDAGYEYELITPHAFPFFVPTQDKIRLPAVAPIPSVCVRVADGSFDLTKSRQNISFDLCFSTWSTGTHGKDIFKPIDRMTYARWTGKDADAFFEKNGDGWRDAWNMVDIALREIRSTTNIGGLAVDRSVPVTFSPLKEQEAIPDYYPFWFAVLTFSTVDDMRVNIDDVQNFL